MGLKLKKITDVCLELVYPENIYCISCRRPVRKTDSYSLCPNCRKKLFYERPTSCLRCGRFVEGRVSRICENCAANEPVYDRAAVSLVYSWEVKSIIIAYKYKGRAYLAKYIGDIMVDAVRGLGEFDAIVPVPMHKDKLKTRGFCQTTLICRRLGELLDKPLITDNLIRIRKTRPMSGLTLEERRRNLSKAFELQRPEELEGLKILLVDDLLTSGTTANICSALLKQAGARAVYLAAFAAPFFEPGLKVENLDRDLKN